MTTQSRRRRAYSRRIGGIVIRPCLSGISSEAPEKSTRRKSREALLVKGACRTRSVSASKSLRDQTNRQRSWPFVITSPPCRSSRNLAGRKSRPLSSRRGVCVPRNMHPPPPPTPPLRATLPHTPPSTIVGDGMLRPNQPGGSSSRPANPQVSTLRIGSGERWGKIDTYIAGIGRAGASEYGYGRFLGDV